jgi:hypothetical protein
VGEWATAEVPTHHFINTVNQGENTNPDVNARPLPKAITTVSKGVGSRHPVLFEPTSCMVPKMCS